VDRLRVVLVAAALLGCAGFARADDMAPPALTIVARTPNVEIRIRGVSLKSVRADETQNEVAFDFNGQVDDAAFAQLQDELPDWIDMAYAGYDNAVIHSKRPVTFLAKAESDGFSLRMVPRAGTPDGSEGVLRGSDDAGPPAPAFQPGGEGRGWKLAMNATARAAAERPFDTMLRGGYDTLRTGDAGVVIVSGDYRHTKGTSLYTSDGRFDTQIAENLRLLGDVHNVVVNTKSVRLANGTTGPLNVVDTSGAAGLRFDVDERTSVSAEGLYGRSGYGGRVTIADAEDFGQIGMRLAYHEPYTDTAEAISLKGAKDYSALYAAGQIFEGLWATGEAQATRYGVTGDQNVARTIGWHGGLRYDIDGWPLSLNYDGDGEYVLNAHKTTFIPLSIRTREVHQFGGSFSDDFGGDIWFDLYGGYAIDRYSTQGGYGGAALRYSPEPGFDIALDGRYSAVAEREGESGNAISAGLRLTYAWGAVDAPIFRSL
jgi:hypothetical protein